MARVTIKSPQDFWGGLVFLGMAGAVLWISRDYPIGTATAMNTGYVPRLLAWILGGIGVVVTARGLTIAGPDIGGWPWRGMIMVSASLIVFALGFDQLGFILTSALLVVLASLASKDKLRLLETFALAIGLSFLMAVVFIVLLGIHMPLWPGFF